MRTRIYIDGKPSWSENEPGHAVLYRGSIRGELVTGAAGPEETRRARDRVTSEADNAERRERYAARREAANAAQRAYYARKKGAA